ncbi:MAG: peptide-methionine (S)-S-oxide reductase MsrA [Candidatus Pacebacteria bacterium]|nr:peptide-methionine (S)-S-oxide reductase MsrA [Candidatus Paceibacterota bacterium]
MTKSLILAGGCFWCVEHDLREAPGVISVTSGYSGGASTSPTYENHAGHREVVLVEYNDSETSYKKLLQFFIDHIDPTDAGGQFADRGESYRTAIYYETEDEKLIAEAVIEELNQSHVYEVPAQVDIVERKPFYRAEEYHQQYAEKNPLRYGLYRQGSGREDFVNKTCKIREEKNIPWSN